MRERERNKHYSSFNILMMLAIVCAQNSLKHQHVKSEECCLVSNKAHSFFFCFWLRILIKEVLGA